MVLHGLRATSWLAWLTGIYFIELPFGTPKFTTWFQPIVIYHFAHIIINGILWIDYILHYNEIIGGKIPIRQTITKIFTYLTLIFTLYSRICFCVFAKRITKMLHRIEYKYRSFIHKTTAGNNNSHSHIKVVEIINMHDHIIINTSIALEIFAAGIFCAAVAWQRGGRGDEKDESWFAILGNFEYSILFFVFGALPVASTMHLKFAFSIVITKHLVHFFQLFCLEFEENIQRATFKIPKLAFLPVPPTEDVSFTIPLLHGNSRELQLNNRLNPEGILLRNSKPVSAEKINEKEGPTLTTPEILLKQLDCLFEIFRYYDNAMGPLFLGLVLSTIMFFVQTVNAITVFDLSELFYAFNWSCLLVLILQLVLVIFNIGHAAHKLVKFCIIEKLLILARSDILRVFL